MRIVNDGRAATEKAVLALGMFDGVHIGHQVLLKRAKVLAGRSHAPLVACTFTEHPLAQIAPDRCPPSLTTFRERAELLEKAGVDLLFAQPFTEEMRNVPPENYVGELMRRFHPTDVVCGYNHTFGKGGSGTSAFLAALGDALGYRTEVVPQVTLGGEEVSSSAIRSAISRGDLKTAARLLGRPYDFSGELICGENGVLLFSREGAGKLGLSEGRYRCILQGSDHPSGEPCVAVVDGGNSYRLLLTEKKRSQQAKLIVLTKINKN